MTNSPVNLDLQNTKETNIAQHDQPSVMTDPSILDDLVEPHLIRYLRAALKAGISLNIPTGITPTRHVYLSHPDKPGCVIIESAEYPTLEQPPRLFVPIAPSRDYGSGVALDVPDCAPTEIAAQVLEQLEHDTIRVRFFRDAPRKPVTRRIPAHTLTLTP